jgi:curli biogenesis system outer membrane secretion channel CsgG
MKMKTKTLLVVAATASALLAGCGKSAPSAASNSVAHLVKDAQARAALEQWCTKDSTVTALANGDSAVATKCGRLDAANWFLKNPKMLALVDKPEPWAGKSQDFFQASANASMPGTKIVKSKIAINVTERAAWGQESSWCAAQIAWKQGSVPTFETSAQDYKSVSPACVAAASVTPPGPF